MKLLHFIVNMFFKIAAIALCISIILSIIGLNFYIVPTGSMEPNIRAGSFVLINENAKYSEIKKGDIIVYSTDKGNQIIHRAIEVSKEGIIVQGDANPIPDVEIITELNFVGKFIFGIPEIGKILQKTNNLPCKIACIVATLGLCYLDFVLDKRIKKSG